MRDKSHMEQVERWARFVKTNPRSVWIKQLKPLIDSQIIKANQFYKKLEMTREGREKIIKLRSFR